MSYGVGNAPQNKTLLKQIESAISANILVVNCTQCLKGTVDMSGYANGVSLQEMGVVSGHDMTPEAALTKLHYLLSKPELSYQQRCQSMRDNLRGELSV